MPEATITKESPATATPPLSGALAETKRLLELCVADPDFAELLASDPCRAGAECGLSIDPERVRPLWDASAARRERDRSSEIDGAQTENGLVADFRAFVRDKIRFRDSLRDSDPDHGGYRLWRRRQMARLRMEIGKNREETIIHAPMALELTRGCSVGCWFCGIDAPRFSDVFRHNEENAALWRAVLRAMGDAIGPFAKWGFCYWATDPMDNPDYEKFCTDFHEELGVFPQTTTALATKDLGRTRSLMQLSARRGCRVNRFSILSLGQLRKVFEFFDPEELLSVECIAQNAEGGLAKARAGKAVSRGGQISRKSKKLLVSEDAGTIACVSGFLFNMVDRRVKLISPCVASPRWPLGYWVIDEAEFVDGEHLRELVSAMMAQHMKESVQELPRVGFARSMSYERTSEGFVVSTKFQRATFSGGEVGGAIQMIGDLVAAGTNTADEIALLSEYQARVPHEATLEVLEELFAMGLLNEEPESPASLEGGSEVASEVGRPSSAA